MSGVSPQLIDLRKRIADKIEKKKIELEKEQANTARLSAEIIRMQSRLAESEIKRVALETGIAEDEALLQNAAPKVRRQRKTKAPQAVGAQAGADAQEGVQL